MSPAKSSVRTKRPPTGPELLRARYDELKRERGHRFSYQLVRDQLRDRLGPDWCPSHEAIRLMHTDAGADPNPIWLAAVCDIYGLDLEMVSPKAHNYLTTVGMHIDKWCHIERIDLRGAKSSCTTDRWAIRPTVERRRPWRPVVEILMRNEPSDSYAKAS